MGFWKHIWNDLTGKTNVNKTNKANLQATQMTNDANLAIANSTNQMQREIAAGNIQMQRETNQQNLNIFNQQRQDALDEREYNSPAAQRARMLAAGLNPASVQSSESGALTSVSAPTMQSPRDDTQLVTPTFQAPHFDYRDQKSDIGTFLDLAAKAVDIYNTGANAVKAFKEAKGQVIDNAFKKEYNKHLINKAIKDNAYIDADIRHKSALAFAQELSNDDYIKMTDTRQLGLKLSNDLAKQSLAVMKEDENLKRVQGDYQQLVNDWLPVMNELELNKFNESVRQFNNRMSLDWSNHNLSRMQFKQHCYEFDKTFQQQQDVAMQAFIQKAREQGLTQQQIDVEIKRMQQQSRQFMMQLFTNSAMTFMNMQQSSATQLATMMLR